jgi:DNA-binding MarR family transcriptional regulator
MSDNKKYLLKYWKFLSLSQELSAGKTFPHLDPVEEHLLKMLSYFWNDGKKITVMQAMRLPNIISNTTVHRRLKSLQMKGLIELKASNSDNRIKNILSTQLTQRYFDTLGRALIAANIEPSNSNVFEY